MIQLMEVPASLWAQVASGSANINGALIKDVATGQILAHLQPAQQLTKYLISSGGNPVLGTVMAGVDIASSVAANIQLHQLKGLVESLQLVAGLGAAAAVVNLGVSIGGFAMIQANLQRLDSKLDAITSKIDNVAGSLDAAFRGRVFGALHRAEEAFSLSSQAERKRFWQESEMILNELIHHSFEKIVGIGLDGSDTLAANSRSRVVFANRISGREAADAIEWLLTCACARVELLLCLEEPLAAGRLSGQIHQWADRIHVTPKELAQARMTGRIFAPTQIKQIAAEAQSMSAFIGRVRVAYEDRASLCKLLDEHRVDTQKFVLDVRNHERPAMLALLMPGAA